MQVRGVLGQDRDATAKTVNGEQIREMPLNNGNLRAYRGCRESRPPGKHCKLGGYRRLHFDQGRDDRQKLGRDGSRNVDTGSNATLFNYPSVDAIAEFKILTNSYDAQFGRNAGGVVNVVTRSGTKEFHGGLYEFHRNDVLQARNPFQTTPLRGLSQQSHEATPKTTRQQIQGTYV